PRSAHRRAKRAPDWSGPRGDRGRERRGAQPAARGDRPPARRARPAHRDRDAARHLRAHRRRRRAAGRAGGHRVNRWRAVAEVALWEFRRYVKPKQQLIGMVITFAMMMGGAAISRLGGDDDGPGIELAVIGADALGLPDSIGRFRIERYGTSALDRLRREV